MKKQKLLGVEKLQDNKYLKFYKAKYKTDDIERDYYFASRHDEADLAINNKFVKPTAIEAITYYEDGDHIYVVMIKEFRSALGKYVYSFPAGLIEEGEDIGQAFEREIYEEIGAETLKVKLLQTYPMPMCAGMTDEANFIALTRVGKPDKQHLEATEDIKVEVFKFEELVAKVVGNELPLTMTGYLGYLALYKEILASALR